MDNQEKKGFLSFTAGTNDKGERVALHVEGYVNKNRNFRPTGEKKAFMAACTKTVMTMPVRVQSQVFQLPESQKVEPSAMPVNTAEKP